VTLVRLRFQGRVQGVGFRAFVRREALARELQGRVRNLPDGGVEAEAEGRREALEAWVDAIRDGPSLARVSEVSVEWSEGPPRWRGFQVV
jgi:acylphosphatase